jgi:hypothetical protein
MKYKYLPSFLLKKFSTINETSACIAGFTRRKRIIFFCSAIACVHFFYRIPIPVFRLLEGGMRG